MFFVQSRCSATSAPDLHSGKRNDFQARAPDRGNRYSKCIAFDARHSRSHLSKFAQPCASSCLGRVSRRERSLCRAPLSCATTKHDGVKKVGRQHNVRSEIGLCTHGTSSFTNASLVHHCHGTCSSHLVQSWTRSKSENNPQLVHRIV